MANDWFDNSTVKGHIFEATAQTIFWTFALLYFGRFLGRYFAGQEWFDRLETHKGGKNEFLTGFRNCLHHFTVGMLAIIGYSLNNATIMRHVTLAEFAFELFDLIRNWYLYLNNYMSPTEGKRILTVWTAHHLPGIIMLIPSSLIFAENIYFQQMAVILLAPASLNAICLSLAKSYDLKKLGERTKFTVVYMINMGTFAVTRLYYFNYACIMFIYYGFHEWTLLWKIGVIVYFIILSFFNLLALFILGARLHRYMNPKSSDNEGIIKESEMMQKSLQTSHSLLPLFDERFSKIGDLQARVKLLPFRRYASSGEILKKRH